MRVYHLLSQKYGLDNIAKSRVKVSKYEDLNDPFELLAGEMSARPVRQAIRNMWGDFNKTKGSISFSKAWNNPVLWSHYADKHRGLAMGFDIPNEYAIEMMYSPNRIPVRYENNHPANGVALSYVDDVMNTKYSHWEYEQEVRMVVRLSSCVREKDLFFKCFASELILREVIVGHRCPLSVEEVEGQLQASGYDAYALKARLAFKSFRVVADQRSVSSSKNSEAKKRYALTKN